jgi:hypothetical protein
MGSFPGSSKIIDRLSVSDMRELLHGIDEDIEDSTIWDILVEMDIVNFKDDPYGSRE